MAMTSRVVGFSPEELANFSNDVEKTVFSATKANLKENEEKISTNSAKNVVEEKKNVSSDGSADQPQNMSETSLEAYIPRGLSERQQLRLLLERTSPDFTSKNEDDESTNLKDILSSEKSKKKRSRPAPKTKIRPRDPKSATEKEKAGDWSIAKKKAYESLRENPNAFYYRHTAPGEEQRNGRWLAEELLGFFRTLDGKPPSNHWGLFSMSISGRVGYQCRNFYHFLLKQGIIVDPDYSTSDGKYTVKRLKNPADVPFSVNLKRATRLMKAFGGKGGDIEQLEAILGGESSPEKGPSGVSEEKKEKPRKRKREASPKKKVDGAKKSTVEEPLEAKESSHIHKRRRTLSEPASENVIMERETRRSRGRRRLYTPVQKGAGGEKATSEGEKVHTCKSVPSAAPANVKEKILHSQRIDMQKVYAVESEQLQVPEATQKKLEEAYSNWSDHVTAALSLDLQRLDLMYRGKADSESLTRYRKARDYLERQYHHQNQMIQAMKSYNLLPTGR